MKTWFLVIVISWGGGDAVRYVSEFEGMVACHAALIGSKQFVPSGGDQEHLLMAYCSPTIPRRVITNINGDRYIEKDAPEVKK